MSNRPGAGARRGRLVMPGVFCAALVVCCFVRLSAANAWFTERIVVDRPETGSISLGASGDGFYASLVDTGWEDGQYLSWEIGDLPLEAPGLADLSGEYLEDDRDEVPGKVWKSSYTFTYLEEENNYPEIYVRFSFNSSKGGQASAQNREQYAQTLWYVAPGGDYVPMPILRFRGQGAYCYYPYPLRPGDSVEMVQLLCFPEDGEEAVRNKYTPRYDLIPAGNNASLFQWNVRFVEGMAQPFDHSLSVETPHAAEPGWLEPPHIRPPETEEPPADQEEPFSQGGEAPVPQEEEEQTLHPDRERELMDWEGQEQDGLRGVFDKEDAQELGEDAPEQADSVP